MLVLVIVLACSVGAFAATKEEIMGELSRPVITKYWETRGVPAEYINAAEKHLDKANFSSETLDKILANMKEGRDLLENKYCEVYLTKLDPKAQKVMTDLMYKTAEMAKVEISVKDKHFYFKSLITGEIVGGHIEKPIQNTGADVTALTIAASALVLTAVAGAFVARKNNLGK